MTEAFIGGRPASLADAVATAAGLFARARHVAIGGLDTDVAGVTGAIGLARRLGGSVSHAHAGPALRDLAVMRASGWIVTTPLQARARADVVLLVGSGIEADWPGMAERLRLDDPPTLFPERPRTVLRLVGDDAADLLTRLSVLRAGVAGRKGVAVPDALAVDAGQLLAARYGVVVWSAARLIEIEIEMLCGLVDDLNARTRFAGLPIAPSPSAAGAMQTAAWLTGLPLPLGFAGPGGVPAHDPWRFDAARLVASGEADAALWLGETTPPWGGAVQTVWLAPGDPSGEPAAAITVGRPGIDHDSVLFDADLGGLVARSATRPSDTPSAAAVLARLATALPC